MKQEAFERERAARWQRFAHSLDELDAGRAVDDFPREYRLLCQDLMLARDRNFQAELATRLNALALRGHQHLYGVRSERLGALDYFLHRVPAAVRREWWLVLLTSLLFYGAAGATFALARSSPELVYSVLGSGGAAEVERMYDPSSPHYARPRASEDGVLAFFYYTGNNIGVALRSFAGGIFFGLGSLFIMFLNSLMIGAVFAHIANVGYGETFLPFVAGHSAFELTAIVLASAAGVRLGLAVLRGGSQSRGAAVREAARTAVPMLAGVIGMLLVAAAIEGLWSPARGVPAAAKYSVGVALWLLVAAWILLGGRGRARA